MSLHQEIIEKLLNEVDIDIKEIMLKTEKHGSIEYKGYELLPDASNTILNWQALRKTVNNQKQNDLQPNPISDPNSTANPLRN